MTCFSHPTQILLISKVYIVPSMSDYDAVICDINIRANPPANPKRNVYLYIRADIEGPRRTLKERFELFQASRPETKSIRANWDQFKADIYNSINEFIPQRTLKNKRSLPWCMQTLGVSSVKSRDVITLHVATERNKFGVDLGISVSWYIKNYSYHTNNM